jgi:hypothetical protein
MTDPLHPEVEILLRRYARDLAQISPSENLDARIGECVAGNRAMQKNIPPPRRPVPGWAAAAGIAAVAILAGVLIGVHLERRAHRNAPAADAVHEPAGPPADFSMWPADSVALQIPAEYSATGALVALDPAQKPTGKRYWIDIIVSNDGTVRIEKVVPAEPANNSNPGSRDGITLQVP